MKAKDLRNSLLMMAIQGKLVEQNPHEEPAGVLLEKIFREKTELIKQKKIKIEKPLPEITDNEKPFDIPDNWEWTRLGEILEINPRSNLDDVLDVSFIPMTLIKDGFNNEHTFEKRKWAEIKNGFTHFANADVAVAKITPCFENRKSVVMKNLINGFGAGTTELHILRAFKNTILPEYLLWFVKNPEFISEGVKTYTGTAGQQRVGKGYLTMKVFPLPPLAEQQRIVAKIEELMLMVDEYEKAETALTSFEDAFPDKLRSSILQAAVQGKLVEQDPSDEPARVLLEKIRSGKAELIKQKKIKVEKPLPDITDEEKPYEIPENWEWARFGELGQYKKGPFGSALTKDIFVPKGNGAVKVYEQKNAIQKNSEIGEYYISRDYFESKMSGFEVHPGDVIVSCAGTIGETYVLPENIEQGIINQALMRMQLFRPIYIPYFLVFFDVVLKQNARSGSKGSAIKNIPPFDVLKNYLVPLPPLAEQERIVAKIEKLLAMCEKLKEA